MAATLIVVAVGLSGCRSGDQLQVQEARARLRTCVGWTEGIAGRAIVKGSEPENQGQDGTDWRVLVIEPDQYYAALAGSVSTRSYLQVAATGRAESAFRNNRREYRAGCPATRTRSS